MAFSPAGITDHPDLDTANDVVLDAAWQTDGTMWAIVCRAGATYNHYLSVYHPDTDTWDTRLLIVSGGGASTDPQAYTYLTLRLCINKNGLAFVIYGTGTSGSARTFWKTITQDLTISSATEFLSKDGGPIDGAGAGGSMSAAVSNECTDFTVVYPDSYAYSNISAADISSATGAVSNRRVVYDGTSDAAGSTLTIYGRSSDVNPVDGKLNIVAEYTLSANPVDAKRYLLHQEEGASAVFYQSPLHLFDSSGDSYYSMRPEMVCDNTVAGRVHVIYQVNQSAGGAANTGTCYIRINDGVFSLETVLFDTGSRYGTDRRSIAIDGNGNVYMAFANSTFPTYTNSMSTGVGMEVAQLTAGTTNLVSRGPAGYYPNSVPSTAVLPRMRPTTSTLMAVWWPGGGCDYNVDPVPVGYITEAESQEGLGSCAGVPMSLSDINHQLYVFDERVYQLDDDEPFA